MLLLPKLPLVAAVIHVHKENLYRQQTNSSTSKCSSKARPNKDGAVKTEVEVFKESSDKTKNNLLLLQCLRHQSRDFPQLMMKCLSKKLRKRQFPILGKKMAPDSLSRRIFTG
uniref:Uncharacterized protein n=1 Tax=Ditylenchus dipsaci TaxID=166011 RepID=A0A915EHW7_9BILA